MEKIIQGLREIERAKGVQILYACETGSRAWGFPSPDSDYDVRFIYKHEKDWYLSLCERRDTMEFALKDDFDVTGWDLKKSLVLLKKSNAALIERFQSPIEYLADVQFRDEFKNLIENYYSPVAVFYHHFSLAKKFWEDIKDKPEIKLKNYFYLLRSLLSCHWIVGDRSVVPMHIEGLMTKIDAKARNRIRELVALKATVGEKYFHSRDEMLDQWIRELWVFLEASTDNLEVSKADYTLLNIFFIKTLHGKADN